MLFDYIAYSANNTCKRCVFVIYIHTRKCTTLIFILMWFGLSNGYNIQDNTGWLFLMVLHLVKMFVWNRLVLTQYSYYRDFYCLWPSSPLHDCTIVGYSPPTGQQLSAILWNINLTVWLNHRFIILPIKKKCKTFFTTKYRNTLHSHYSVY